MLEMCAGVELVCGQTFDNGEQTLLQTQNRVVVIFILRSGEDETIKHVRMRAETM